MKYLIICLIAFSSSFVSAQGSNSKPIRVMRGDGVVVRVYDFKAIEPLLKKSNDTTYVVNFWATWCKPCVEELPNFEMATIKNADKKVKILLVSLDMKKDADTKLLSFIKKKNIKSEVVFLNDPDSNSWIEKVDRSWSGALPATLIYNQHEREFYEQSFTFEALQNQINKFIK